VALGKAGRKVIAIIGDGSSMYSIQALWSAAQLDLPVTFVIVNNHAYEALNGFARRFGLEKSRRHGTARDRFRRACKGAGPSRLDGHPSAGAP
jgi:benzoylformate decarboxylase